MTATCAKATATPHIGEVAFGYWQTLCMAIRNVGLDMVSLGNEERAVSVEHYLSQFEKGMSHTSAFGLMVGKSVSLKTFPVLGMTLLSCSNLEQALAQILRYESLSHDLGRSYLYTDSHHCSFQWRANPKFLTAPDSDLGFELALSVFAGIMTFAPLLLQKDLTIARVNFTIENSEARSEIEAFFNCPVYFGQDDNSIEVPKDLLSWELTFGDPTTFAALTAHADTLLLDEKPQQDFVRRIQELLPKALRKQAFRVEDIAEVLNLSSRSVQRKLKEEGVSYQSLLDKTRLELAKHYLRENKLSMSEIAFLIGYQEQSSFNHAFKSWTGLSPSDYRDN